MQIDFHLDDRMNSTVNFFFFFYLYYSCYYFKGNVSVNWTELHIGASCDLALHTPIIDVGTVLESCHYG